MPATGDHKFLRKLPDPSRWKWISQFEETPALLISHPKHRRWMSKHQEKHLSREVMICLEGRHFYGRCGKIWRMAPGTVMLLEAEEPHDAIYSPYQPSCRDMWFHLFSPSSSFINDVSITRDGKKTSCHQSGYAVGRGGPFAEIVHLAWDNCHKNPQSSLHFAQLKAAITCMIVEILLHSSQVPRSEKKSNQQQLMVEQIETYIITHLGDDLSLATLSKRAGYDPIYFHRLFAKFTGEPIHQFINRHRIQRAQSMLRDGLKVGSVAEALGFATHSYFCRFFKRETGMTAGEWLESFDFSD